MTSAKHQRRSRFARALFLGVCIATSSISSHAQRAPAQGAPAQGAPAQGTPASPTVLFVCEHGTVRSLIAKVLFEEYAAKVGLKMSAISRGTAADSVVPPWLMQRFDADHIDIGLWRPQTLRASDLTNAAYVVSFDVPSAATSASKAPRAQWDSLPSVSRDYITGRDAIKLRVHRLVDSLAQSQPAPARRR